MKLMKIALFTGNYHHIRDGVSITLNRWVKYATHHGTEVKIFAPTIENPPMAHEGHFIPVPSIAAPGRPEYRMSLFLPSREREQLESFQPDLVHIATPDLLGLAALRWAKHHQKKIAATFHTNFASYLKYYGFNAAERAGWSYLIWFYNQCDHVYVPTTTMLEELVERGVKVPMSIWARGVDMDQFTPERRSSAWREQLGISKNDTIISFISRLVWEKNIRLYATTVNRLMQRYPDVKAFIAGDGPAREELQAMIPRGVFTGFIQGEELADAYANSDIFLFPSDTETFGNVTLEAMSSGVPCIVADAPGSGSLVEDGENGYVISLDDEDAFFSRAEWLHQNKSLRLEMGKASRMRAGNFRRDKIQKGFLDSLHRLTES